MHPKTYAVIQQRGLCSLMNHTKWTELACALSAIGSDGPVCEDKKIDNDHIDGPSHINWHDFLEFPTERYEWLEIHATERKFRGHLVADEIIDHATEIEAILRELKLPFSLTENGYRVWGYVHPANQPAYA